MFITQFLVLHDVKTIPPPPRYGPKIGQSLPGCPFSAAGPCSRVPSILFRVEKPLVLCSSAAPVASHR